MANSRGPNPAASIGNASLPLPRKWVEAVAGLGGLDEEMLIQYRGATADALSRRSRRSSLGKRGLPCRAHIFVENQSSRNRVGQFLFRCFSHVFEMSIPPVSV